MATSFTRLWAVQRRFRSRSEEKNRNLQSRFVYLSESRLLASSRAADVARSSGTQPIATTAIVHQLKLYFPMGNSRILVPVAA